MLDLEMINCFADEGIDLLIKWETSCLALERNPTAEEFNNLFRVAHNLKGSSRSVGLEEFGEFVHQLEDGITLLKAGEAKLSRNVVLALLKAQAMLNEWLVKVKTNPSFSIDTSSFMTEFKCALEQMPLVGAAETGPASPFETEKIAVVAPETDVGSAPSVSAQAPAQGAPASSSAGAPSAPASNQPPADETIRVSARKLDQILEMVGELSIHQSIIWHGRQKLDADTSALSHAIYLSRKLTKELYERSLSLRMYPVQPIFQRLERSIREIALSQSKEVSIEIVGGEVELDKTVCEKIVEPLTHMVRNSVDHGLEMPEQRRAAGKDAGGRIKISAIQESGSVVLKIEDDGKGLSQEKILQKAKNSGIWNGVTPLTQPEVFALIFLPGFSTAEKVTAVSGRGVGMDVVMRAIDDLSGKITIASEEGKGTRFEITLPTTLSIIDALIVIVDGVDYAVPVSCVDEILTLSDWEADSTKSRMRIRDQVIPLEPLRNYVLHGKKPATESPAAIVTRFGNQSVAFCVDKVSDPQPIVVRKLSAAMSRTFGISGGTILSNGKPGLILDLPSISRSFFKQFKQDEKAA